VKATLTALLPKVSPKNDSAFLDKHLTETRDFYDLLNHYVDKGPRIKPIRPEFLAATLCHLASQGVSLARHIRGGTQRRFHGSLTWASMANAAGNAFGAQLSYPGRQTIALCGDGGFTSLGLGDLLTQVRLHIIFNNGSLNFVGIEQQEAGIVPFGVDFNTPNFAKVAEAMGAKGIGLEEPGDVKNVLAEALAYKDGPIVVDAVVDRLALSLPSHVPFHVARGFTLSMAKQVLTGHMDPYGYGHQDRRAQHPSGVGPRRIRM
jgi:pyruvate dehydrogenase (quinone)